MRPPLLRVVTSALAVWACANLSGRGAAAPEDAEVRGRVEVGIPIAARRAAAAYPSRAISPQPLAPASEVQHVVVYLKNAPARHAPPVRVDIRQRNETFVPRVAAVPVGSEVRFPNDDHIYHNVFSLSRAGTFNLGRYPFGKSGSARFDTPGVVKVFCDIHSHMSATVLVFDHPWFAVPDAQGRFALSGLPAGDQDIAAWHERLGETTLRVSLEPGRTSAADFMLPVPPR
jgi:plastocyanin